MIDDFFNPFTMPSVNINDTWKCGRCDGTYSVLANSYRRGDEVICWHCYKKESKKP
jgi:hypothetical protein